jgi:hypothetical protein
MYALCVDKIVFNFRFVCSYLVGIVITQFKYALFSEFQFNLKHVLKAKQTSYNVTFTDRVYVSKQKSSTHES